MTIHSFLDQIGHHTILQMAQLTIEKDCFNKIFYKKHMHMKLRQNE